MKKYLLFILLIVNSICAKQSVCLYQLVYQILGKPDVMFIAASLDDDSELQKSRDQIEYMGGFILSENWLLTIESDINEDVVYGYYVDNHIVS